MSYKKPEQDIQRDTDKIITLIEERGHIFIEGEYRNRESILVVYCPIHDQLIETTFYNYGRAKTVLPCCGKELVSNKLKYREFSVESRSKMTESALERPKRGGKPRKWRENKRYWDWREEVLSSYNHQCAITGLSNSDNVDLEVHHLYSADAYSNLTYNVDNGIVLTKEIHKLFHKTKGYGSNTIDQFQDFLIFILNQTGSMPISSQANSEGLEGSETRAYDPERVMKLHERLEILKQKIK